MTTKFRQKIFQKRVLITSYIVMCAIVLYNYFFLQIIEFEKFNEKAGNNSIRKIILNAPRGIIYDRNKIPLVDNKPLYNIELIPKDIEKDFNYSLFKEITGIDSSYIDSIIHKNKYLGSSFKPKVVKRYIDFEMKSIIEEYKLDLNGVYFSELPARTYTSDCNLTHVLGYLRQIDQEDLNTALYKSDDIIGYSGIEKYYEQYLRGEYGVDYYLVNSLGIVKNKYEKGNLSFKPKQGDSIILSIDSKLQKFVENKMKNMAGTIIIMNPNNGEILSLVSNPDYDLKSFIGPIPINNWKNLINNSNKPFTNRAIQATYPPGSIFKLLLSAIALENNKINQSRKINCEGVYDFHNTAFKCWKEEGHGEINLSSAIKQSCNIYFYNLMQDIEFDLWSKESERLGFNKKTFVDLPSEVTGNIPNRKYMNKTYKDKGGWSTGHLLNFSIGQGEVLVTPIQVIQLINLIANEGKFFYPSLRVHNEKEFQLVDYKNHVWKFIKKAMYDAVNGDKGTAYKAKIDNSSISIYGKTGTAQVCSNCDSEPHAWFTGFMEFDNKLVSICILIENGGKGSNIPSEISGEVFDYILNNVQGNI